MKYERSNHFDIYPFYITLYLHVLNLQTLEGEYINVIPLRYFLECCSISSDYYN